MPTLVSRVFNNTVMVKEFIKSNPGVSIGTLTQELKIQPGSLYHVLYALIDDPEVCAGDKFKVTRDGIPITVSEVRGQINKKTMEKDISPIERVIFLYKSLFESIEDGGLTFEQIKRRYEDFLETDQSDEALKRMIFRDIKILSKSLKDEQEHALKRPDVDSNRYRLNLDYIPRLMPESAAAVYLGMTLLKGTVMDEPVAFAQKEIGKAYLKKQGKNSNALKQRFYCVKDTLAQPKSTGNTFRVLTSSIIEGHAIRIQYEKITGEKSDRIVEPLGMLAKRGVWYLIARTPGTEDMRAYRVDQIDSAYARERMKFEYPQGFTVESYVGDSWGIYSDDEVRRVVLRFSSRVARRVKNLCYHHSQRVIEQSADGSLLIEFNVCGHVELVSWILQWGHQVEVIESEDLREKVREAALSIAKQYESSGQGRQIND